tara:strand:+ start:1459 stop:2010 length:552 start_codon:yes stop_codon:yes gene_type:complete
VKNLKDNEIAIQEIDKCLPQTHCQKCGFVSCMPYAKAIVKKKTTIYKCEPGGTKVVEKIAKITEEEIVKTNIKEIPPELVYVNPEACIGCALCLPKCPVDAIAGAEGFLHTVIVDECNGCGLCIDSCPVDCIVEKKRPTHIPWTDIKAENSKRKFYEKKARDKKYKLENRQDNLEHLKRLLFK